MSGMESHTINASLLTFLRLKMQGFSVTPLLPVAIGLMTGIAIAHWWLPAFPLVYLLLAAVVAAYACHRRPVAQSTAIYLCCLVLGMTLTQLQHNNDSDIHGRELRAVVMSEPTVRAKTVGVDLLLPEANRTLRCYLHHDDRSQSLRLGDALVVKPGSLTTPEERSGTAPTVYFIRGNGWNIGGDALSRMSRTQRSRLWFLNLRHQLLKRYQDFHPETDTYAVLAAMTLGDKSAPSRELRETYAISGASHVLAISGLHVGIVYMLLTWLMLGRRYFWLSQAVTVAAIWAFALLTGLSPSVSRAATMITIYSVFAARGGRKAPVNVLCFAAIVMLVAHVQTLFDIGFQLSFAAVLAILAFMPLLQSIYQPHNSVLRWAWNLAMLSLCAQIGVAPLLAYYFGRFSTYFLLTNFLVIPAATLILYGAFLTLLFPSVSILLIWIVKAMNESLHVIASLPGASIEGLHPTPLQVAIIYVLFLLCYLTARRLTSIFHSDINMRVRRLLSPHG